MGQRIQDDGMSRECLRRSRPGRAWTATVAVLSLSACANACAHAGAAARPAAAPPTVTGPAPERRLLERALHYLPAPVAYPIRIIDPEAVPDPDAVRRLDAFIVTDDDGSLRPAIYINRQSPMLREALRGTDVFPQMLAAVVVHEAAHLAGQSEAAAREAEAQFFSRLVDRGLVPLEPGRRYLTLLKQQRSGPAEGIALPGRQPEILPAR